MLNYLKKTLANVQQERDKVVAPYDKRIRAIKTAIANIEDFDSLADEINLRTVDPAVKAVTLKEK